MARTAASATRSLTICSPRPSWTGAAGRRRLASSSKRKLPSSELSSRNGGGGISGDSPSDHSPASSSPGGSPVLAFLNGSAARAARHQAESRGLAASAEAVLSQNPQLAAKRALQALNVAHT